MRRANRGEGNRRESSGDAARVRAAGESFPAALDTL